MGTLALVLATSKKPPPPPYSKSSDGRVEAAGAVEFLGVAEGVELGLARRGDRLGGRAVACRPPQQPRTMSGPGGGTGYRGTVGSG